MDESSKKQTKNKKNKKKQKNRQTVTKYIISKLWKYTL